MKRAYQNITFTEPTILVTDLANDPPAHDSDSDDELAIKPEEPIKEVKQTPMVDITDVSAARFTEAKQAWHEAFYVACSVAW
ncbi:uncharacterized protein N7529_008691 [Penicillium soppii]|uniref:uncharacterized protein n=1 Tax=Penicillium soppii TaxID=69789 RepID=UPI00254988A9|nr:uncharacterized protein N7529_008691 [Penicillium soppii]KAJ5861381.1 hypothetical protein N7529_008691 [Penicillium soppii]